MTIFLKQLYKEDYKKKLKIQFELLNISRIKINARILESRKVNSTRCQVDFKGVGNPI